MSSPTDWMVFFTRSHLRFLSHWSFSRMPKSFPFSPISLNSSINFERVSLVGANFSYLVVRAPISRANFSIYPCHLSFFQAEDGIRDDLVTGVQTCALPI